MRWIVISDLHFNYPKCNYDIEIMREKLIQNLRKDRIENGEFSFIIIAGDILYQNKETEDLVPFLQKLRDACGIENKLDLFICPGNHDVERFKGETHSCNKEIDEDRADKTLERQLNSGRYARFKEYYREICDKPYSPFSFRSPSHNKNCVVISLDSCALSKDDSDMGFLRVCDKQLSSIERELKSEGREYELKIAFMHHSINWLAPDDSLKFQHWIADNRINVLYCGHDHAVGITKLSDAISENGYAALNINQFTSGACMYDADVIPSYYICEWDENESIKTKLYTFRETSEWSLDTQWLRSFPGGENIFSLVSHHSENKKIYEVVHSNSFDKVYENLAAAKSDICNDLESSNHLYFFGLRGKSFERFGSEMADTIYNKPQMSVRLLVSYPFCKAVGNRLRCIPELQNKDDYENYWSSLYDSAIALRKSIKNSSRENNRKIRYHKLQLNWRLIITDQHLFFSFYQNCDSSKSKMYSFRSNTDVYTAFKNYFDEMWLNGIKSIPSEIPDEYAFLKDKFDIIPNLVINITDKCNLQCVYCPTGGENLVQFNTDQMCSVDQINNLVNAFYDRLQKDKPGSNKAIRITGGEPLLFPDRTLRVLQNAYEKGYNRIVLCTNGICFEELYQDERYRPVFDCIKEKLLLKISLDTLNSEVFRIISRADRTDVRTIARTIHNAKTWGFAIELNCVAMKENVSEILDLYNFARQEHLVGLKVLTVNDFGNRIHQPNIREELNDLYESLTNNQELKQEEAYLYGNNGIQMKRFYDDENCKLTIVDHQNQESSITPRRTYSSKCKMCRYYPNSEEVSSGQLRPCATGIMSLTLRADGQLCYCRLRAEETSEGKNISSFNSSQLSDEIDKQLLAFKGCFHYENKKGKGE